MTLAAECDVRTSMNGLIEATRRRALGLLRDATAASRAANDADATAAGCVEERHAAWWRSQANYYRRLNEQLVLEAANLSGEVRVYERWGRP